MKQMFIKTTENIPHKYWDKNKIWFLFPKIISVIEVFLAR